MCVFAHVTQNANMTKCNKKACRNKVHKPFGKVFTSKRTIKVG